MKIEGKFQRGADADCSGARRARSDGPEREAGKGGALRGEVGLQTLPLRGGAEQGRGADGVLRGGHPLRRPRHLLQAEDQTARGGDRRDEGGRSSECKAEADQDPSWTPTARRQRFAKSRSLDTDGGGGGSGGSGAAKEAPNLDLKRQLTLLEQENRQLKRRLATAQSDAASLAKAKTNGTTPNAAANGEMAADIERFIGRIGELERQKEALSHELERRKALEAKMNETPSASTAASLGSFNPSTASADALREKLAALAKDSTSLSACLRKEKERSSALEGQLGEYKALIGQSENQQLVLMASKVEVVGQQLREAHERFDAAHRRATKDAGDKAYADGLRDELRRLEAELADARLKAAAKLPATTATTSASSPTSAQQSSELLETLAGQAERIYTQLEALEKAQKPKPSPVANRVGSTAAAAKPAVLKDLAKIKEEMDALRGQLKTPGWSGGGDGGDSEELKTKLRAAEARSAELKEQLELVWSSNRLLLGNASLGASASALTSAA